MSSAEEEGARGRRGAVVAAVTSNYPVLFAGVGAILRAVEVGRVGLSALLVGLGLFAVLWGMKLPTDRNTGALKVRWRGGGVEGSRGLGIVAAGLFLLVFGVFL